jgi:acyl-CoA reductase-like NAD-dependent aldehyde dehydrogenase
MARGIGSKPAPSTPAELDLALERLDSAAPHWAALEARARAELLAELAGRFHELSPRMAELDCRQRGLSRRSPRAGEPTLDGPAIIVRYALELARTLAGEQAVPASAVREVGPRTVVSALPMNAWDALTFLGYRAEAWLDGSFTREQAVLHPTALPRHAGEVALVLGAGNVPSIGVLDALEQLFVRGRACLLKLSPVNDYLGPFVELACAPLVARGFMAFAYGGPDVGAYLTAHPAVDALHVTGSYETHEAIVWGSDRAERHARKARGEPRFQKPVTSELGNVSPAVVVPGKWTETELDHAARSIVGSFTFNAGFNCNATKLVVTPRGSRLRAALIERITRILAEVPPRRAYYPGAHEKYRRFTTDGGQVSEFTSGHALDQENGESPWALVTDLVPQRHPACLEHEPFCAVLSEVSVEGDDPIEFLANATRLLNERVWGTLNAMLLVPGANERDARLSGALDEAIGALRYGAVCVNIWPAVSYGLGTLPWGGHPSATLADAQSGLGWGHNALLLQHVEKTVLRGPLVPLIKPLWYPDHRNLAELGTRLVDFQAAPSVRRLVPLVAAALRG